MAYYKTKSSLLSLQKNLQMKKISILLIISLFIGNSVYSQGLSESIKKKFTVGADVFTDIWVGAPDNIDLRTIQQGATVFGMFNFPLGGEESLTTFSIGLGVRSHNMYSNSRIDDIKADTINFTPIPDDVIYQRSKVNLVYLDLPVELKLRFKNGFKTTIGFKAGWAIDSKEKYVGDRYEEYYGNQYDYTNRVGVNETTKDIRQLEKFSYGPTLRIGYKFISVYGYYQISSVFKRNLGPDMAPISIGLTITPF